MKETIGLLMVSEQLSGRARRRSSCDCVPAGTKVAGRKARLKLRDTFIPNRAQACFRMYTKLSANVRK